MGRCVHRVFRFSGFVFVLLADRSYGSVGFDGHVTVWRRAMTVLRFFTRGLLLSSAENRAEKCKNTVCIYHRVLSREIDLFVAIIP